MEIENEKQNQTDNDEIEIAVDDETDDEKSSHSDSGNRNGFFIQDILSPEFGSRQLKDQYYAYIQYCYSLQMHNMMLLRGAVAARNGLTSPLMSSFTHAQQKITSQFSTPAISKDHFQNLKLTNTPEKDVSIEDGFSTGNSYIPTSTFKERVDAVIKPQPICPRNCQPSSKPVIIPSVRDTHKNESKLDDSGHKRKQQPSLSPGSEKTNSESPEVSPERKEGFSGETSQEGGKDGLWPAWVYCTRYSDRPSSGPRSRKIRRKETTQSAPEKRPRIAFTNEQLSRLKREFDENRYLTEERRAKLADELDLTDAQVKIWFQNKRAKLKKTSGIRNPLALSLMAQGLYNHATNASAD